MSTDLQYRLQQHEIIPPEDVWNKIALRLDGEYDQHDISLAQKLSDTAQTPPELWHSVLSQLDNAAIPEIRLSPARGVAPETRASAGERKGRVLPFRLERIAAVFALAIAVSALYYFLSRDSDDAAVAFTDVPAHQQAGLSPSLALPRVIPQLPPEVTHAAPRNGVTRSISTGTSRSVPVIAAAYNADEADMSYPTTDLTYAAVDEANKLARGERIAVASQPIRDGAGNIILDEKLVSAPDENYVTVTGPNGEQTKISKKFLHALSYMNSSSADDDYMGVMLHEGSLWKWLFQEWRQKLLTQPSFIPSAANFLDIMELKEILHENL